MMFLEVCSLILYNAMNKSNIICCNELVGWRLNVAFLRLVNSYARSVLAIAIEGTVERFRRKHTLESIAANKVVQEVRSLMGCACPFVSSFETLAQRILEGGGISLDRPAEAFRDILSLKSLVPWSVMAFAKLKLPLTFRTGMPGDVWKGPSSWLNLEGYPVLRDEKSVVASPVIFDEGALVEADCYEILLVCYAPATMAREVNAKGHLGQLVHMSAVYRFIEERAFLPKEGVKQS